MLYLPKTPEVNMARPKKSINNNLVKKAKEAQASLNDCKLSLKLQAIIAYSDNPVKEVANIIGVSENMIFLWLRKFKKQGIEGLRDKPKGHKAALLTDNDKIVIKKWILSSKNSKGRQILWTLDKLQSEIKNELNVQIGITALWNNLKSMDLKLKRPRPSHAKSNPEEQTQFKKNEKTS